MEVVPRLKPAAVRVCVCENEYVCVCVHAHTSERVMGKEEPGASGKRH